MRPIVTFPCANHFRKHDPVNPLNDSYSDFVWKRGPVDKTIKFSVSFVSQLG